MTLQSRIVVLVLIEWLMLCAAAASAQLPFFSGAEGFGGTFSGTPPAAGWFSNATVYHVTNLNDSGPGSLRGAFVQNSANKIVVFDVAGTIQLTSGSLDIKNLSNYYIAGQTAPGPVTIYGNTTQITHSNSTNNSNVVLRYLTFRKGVGNGEDAITFSGGDGIQHSGRGSNMIIDHVSASWSEDEVLSVANNNTNVTVQYSMITDSLTSDHAYGSLIRPRIDAQVTFHHNLYGNDKSRNPRPGTYYGEELTLDFRNNVVYNWSDRAGYTGGAGETNAPTENVDLNYVGNYVIAGPSTPAGTRSQTAFTKDIGGDPVNLKVYQSGNVIDSDHDAIRDGIDTGWAMFRLSNGGQFPDSDKSTVPFPAPAATTQSALAAYNQVVGHVGNHWWSRNAIDARIIGNVQNNTNPPGGIGAASPDAAELSALLNAPPIARSATWDTDQDGMPNWWELDHGLNASSNLDFKNDFDNDGYINLFEYLDEAGAFPAPVPIVFAGGTNSRYAQITNWKTNDGGLTAGSFWQPSRFDEARINSGSVVVDAVGQHAGRLQVGATAGSNATFNVTSGRIQIEDELVIGSAGATATVNLSGGVLRTTVLDKHESGSFNFTGGILQADTVTFDLIVNGGTLATKPGDIQSDVLGDLTVVSGGIQFQLASNLVSDVFVIHGDATLGGRLEVVLLGDYTPVPGDNWQILSAESLNGQFASISPGYHIRHDGNALRLYFGAPPPELAGDYNNDGTVDAADYVVWRQALVSGAELPNETESPGIIDHSDYAAWRANFGAARPSAAGTAGETVPEPSAVAMFLLLIGQQLFRRGRRVSHRNLRIFGSFCKNGRLAEM
jgi:pectate lyase